MKNENDVELWWQQQANYFNSALGYYELSLLEEAEAELNKIDRSAAIDAVPILALRLNICYQRSSGTKWQPLQPTCFFLINLTPAGCMLTASRRLKLIPSKTKPTKQKTF